MDTATDLRALAQELEDDGIVGAVLCVVAANEIDRLRSAEVLYKREIMAADAIVRIGSADCIVASKVKAEIEHLRATLAKLRMTAVLLLQNAEGCAVNHYGDGYQTHGRPGWLSDCQIDIDAAYVALNPAEEVR